MRHPRVLVVYKRDAYQQYVQRERNPRLRQLLRVRQPDAVDIRCAHAVHQASLKSVVRALERLPVDVQVLHRFSLPSQGRHDLVVSVGGDGTFLQAARQPSGTPILGINSDPARSEAVFCAATRKTFPRLIAQALAGRLSGMRLYRLRIALNGRPIAQHAVNDILLAHPDPATMSRYRIRIGRRRELQKSSGLWLATAAGSSSAMRAAGGVRLPWRARRFQYRPRELYVGRLSDNRLTGGVLRPGQRVLVTWLMSRGDAFVDGSRARIPLRFADTLDIRLSLSDPVYVLGLRGQ
jgi:NAD+ kinase